MSGEIFLLEPAAGGGVEVWSNTLGRKLAELEQSPTPQVVIVSSAIEDGGPYVQCLIPHAPGVWSEAVSNRFLAGTAWELTADQERLLAELGWQPPTPEFDPDDPEGLQQIVNWWHPWEHPVDTFELAWRLVVTLLMAYGLSDQEPWKLETFEGVCDGCWDR